MKQQRGTAILLPILVGLVVIAGSVFGLIPFIGWVVSIGVSLLSIVLMVGVYGAFIKIYKGENADLAEPFNGISFNFLRKLGGQLLMSLFVFLWTLLLIIPGIIMSYAYVLVPYILADLPNVTATDALKLSRRMMAGNKATLFVAHLSFIGWFLLGSLTLHILNLVFVAPYFSTTMAGYYEEIKADALARGVVTAEELGLETEVFAIQPERLQ
jgi:uncharacterized membrane protein